MRFAYADPPYLGCAKIHYSNDPSEISPVEVDHAHLIEKLNQFDAWALSSHSPGLKFILPLCPDDVRIAAWVKPFASYKPNVNPAYAWEPVIFKRPRSDVTVPDWVSANITLKRGTHGAKPDAFCFWIFALMGLERGDEVVDLFPGSGSLLRCWNQYKRTIPLFV